MTSLLQLCSHCNGRGECWQGYCRCGEGYATALSEVAGNASSRLDANSSSALSSAPASLLSSDDAHACTLLSCPLDCAGNGVCALDGASQSYDTAATQCGVRRCGCLSHSERTQRRCPASPSASAC